MVSQKDFQLREFCFPLLMALVCAAAGTIPYAYAYLHAPPGQAFMGFVGRGSAGLNGYLMLARQVQEGYHLVENLATPEPLPRSYFNLEWWLFGMFARLSGLSLILTFHLDRLLTCALYCVSTYYLAAQCLRRVAYRRLALTLLVLNAGFGWLLLLMTAAAGIGLPQTFDWPSLDLQGVSIGLYLVNQPHFVRAVALAALTYAWLIQGERTGQLRFFVLAGVAAFLHTMVRPYNIPETYAVLLALPALLCLQEGRWRWRRFAPYALVGLVLFPAVLYYAYLARTGMLGMSGWVRQSRFLFSTFLWQGWPIFLVTLWAAWFGARRGMRMQPATLLLALWLVISWLLVNTFPFFNAGHEAAFVVYTTVPILLALMLPLPWVYREARRRVPVLSNRVLALCLLLLISIPSNVYAYTRLFTTLDTPVSPDCYYLPESVLEALRWLDAHTEPGTVVLSSEQTAQFIPRYSDNKVVTYHDMLTADYYEKRMHTNQFFAHEEDDGFKRWFIGRHAVNYVVVGPLERALGAFAPEQHPWLAEVYRNKEVTVWKVQAS